jgi:cytochrome c
MKALLLAIAVAGSMLVATQAGAVDAAAAQALAQKSGCLACHSIDKKVLGPAYKDVAAKYKGDKTAEAKLIAKVKAGGSGVWGPMPMPANSPQVKDADIKTVVEWVLSL